MAQHPELEIGLFRLDVAGYAVELRFKQPDDAAMREPVRGRAEFDTAELRGHALDPEAYGRALSAGLFADERVLNGYRQARVAAQAADEEQALRLRLLIDRSAFELHDLRWETLRDPDSGAWLLTDENLLFSRFLASSDWRSVRLRPRADLRALAFIANPADLAGGDHRVDGRALAPIEVQTELERAEAGLGPLLARSIASDPAQPGQAGLPALINALREGYDILYLVAHGAILNDDPPGPYLWLEKPDGSADVVSGLALVEHLRDLSQRERPMLIVLASCESAGTGRTTDEGALAALGPRLVEAGIPAVIAMQGSVSMNTIAAFVPLFFSELRRHGQLDRAMAAARGTVRDESDAWMPALFTRLWGGSIWGQAGFGVQELEFRRWNSLISSLREEKCTPILGPGLLEFMFGSTDEIARRWATQAGIPRALCNHDSLPQVAQYLAMSESLHFPSSELKRHLETEIWQRSGHLTRDPAQFEQVLAEMQAERTGRDPASLLTRVRRSSLQDLIAALGHMLPDDRPDHHYNILAQLPVSVYINGNPDNLLFEVLRRRGDKDPVEACFVWKDSLRELEGLPLLDPEDRFRPSVEQPMVYHLFGHVGETASMVVSEDDYFDYLMRVNDDTETDIPSFVDRALGQNALLFLGFDIDDWNFRVLFRSIMNEERRYRRREHQSVAVQIDLSEGSQQPERARSFLEEYFGDSVSVYWGSAEDFLKELWQRWQNDGE